MRVTSRHITRAAAPRLLAVALAAAMAGCVETEPPTLRLLPEFDDPRTASASARNAIAVATVSMPDYAEATGIATREPGGGVAQSSSQAWGDQLSRAATRRLAAALTAETGRLALAEPWPLEFSPTRRVDVLVDRFLGGLDGPTELSGEFRVMDSRTLRSVERFSITVAPPAAGWDGLVEAHAEALRRLAVQIAATL
jgi:uncharacterized lipoprotein YmbA